jgi:predicted nucleotidyltransferase
VKPLLYVYRVLLTGIHLMRTGVVNANLPELNEEARLSYVADLIARKQSGENTVLEDADVAFHYGEYERLRGELQAAHDGIRLREVFDLRQLDRLAADAEPIRTSSSQQSSSSGRVWIEFSVRPIYRYRNEHDG